MHFTGFLRKLWSLIKEGLDYMKANPGAWLYVAFIGLACFLIVWAVLYYAGIRKPVMPLIDAVPPNPALLANFNNAPELFDKVLSESNICNEFFSIEELNTFKLEFAGLDSIVSTNSYPAEILMRRSLMLAVYINEKNQTEILYLISLPDDRQSSNVKRFIGQVSKDGSEITSRKYSETEVFSLVSGINKTVLHWTVYKGVFAASFTPELIEKTIFQLENPDKSLKTDRMFGSVFLTTGKKVDGNVFVNYKYFAQLSRRFTAEKHSSLLKSLSTFASWSGLDMTIKQDALLLNGYTSASDDEHFLGLFNNRVPPQMTLTSYIPYNTSFLLYFGIDDFTSYYPAFKNYSADNKTKDVALNNLMEKAGKSEINIEELFTSIIGKEFALVYTASDNTGWQDNVFAVINVTDSIIAKEEILKLSDHFPEESIITDTSQSKGFIIGSIALPPIMPALFGQLFGAVNKNYYLLYENYLVFGNSLSSLQRFIAYVYAGKTLASNQNFTNFSYNITGEANLLIYGNIRKSVDIFGSFLSEDLQSAVKKNIAAFSNFEAFALQFTAKDRMFYTGFCIKHNPAYIEENPAIWEMKLDTTPASVPFIVWDYRDNSNKIVVFDVLNNMYMIDNQGMTEWKINLPEEIISKLYQVDMYKNTRLQFVFNSVNNIYVVDINGEFVSGSPYRLPVAASAGMSVFDYDNKKDYRLIVPLINQSVVNYSVKGNPVAGWINPKLDAKSQTPIMHFRLKNNDLLVTASEKGTVYVINRRGGVMFTSSVKFRHAKNAGFYTDGNAVITAGTDGIVYFLYSKTKTELRRLGKFSQDLSFTYLDINSDGKPEFIIVDNGVLKIFNKAGKLMYEYNNKPALTSYVFVGNSEKNKILIIPSVDGYLMLFNYKGQIKQTNPLLGSGLLSAGSLTRKDAFNIVSVHDNKLYNYLIE